jgi:pyridoxal phosphate enzyme (YggS family)
MMEPEIQSIKKNIESVKGRIEKAAVSAGRDPSGIELIAVTKEKPAVTVKTLYDCGIRKIGESYIKEALFKIGLLGEYQIEWHMIGTVQSGKAGQIIQYFDQVHSVDRIELARELNAKCLKSNKTLPIYLECNVSGEMTKHGWSVWKEGQWDLLLPEIEEILDMESLMIQGLMTMAPYSENPEESRPFFKKLRGCQEFLERRYPNQGFSGLSMGMSGDFEVAIQEGASAVRIGTALVGQR